MTPSVVTVTVDGQAHRVVIPHEWSGGLAFVVNCHRGQASKKLLVGRLAAILLEHGSERGPRLEPGGRPAVGGAGQEAAYGGQEETPDEAQG